MRKNTKRILLYAFIGSLLVGIVISALAMYIAWDHNAQGEIYTDSEIYWGYWFSIGFIYLITVFSMLFTLTGLLPVGILKIIALLKGKE